MQIPGPQSRPSGPETCIVTSTLKLKNHCCRALHWVENIACVDGCHKAGHFYIPRVLVEASVVAASSLLPRKFVYTPPKIPLPCLLMVRFMVTYLMLSGIQWNFLSRKTSGPWQSLGVREISVVGHKDDKWHSVELCLTQGCGYNVRSQGELWV